MKPDAETVVREWLEGHTGEDPILTLSQGDPNWITNVNEEAVWVETDRSRRQGTGPQRVPLEWLIDAYEVLQVRGLLTRRDLTVKSSKRSAFIFAVLARLPGVEWQDRPIELRLRP